MDDQSLKPFIQKACQESFLAFNAYVYPGYLLSPHIEELAEKLELVEKGHIRKLLVNMPPRHSKTQHTGRLFPAWFLGKHPDKEIIFTTYNQTFADDIGKDVKNLIMEESYNHVFPNVKVAMDSKANAKFSFRGHRGKYVAVGIDGAVTGRGADVAIFDDPHKNRADALSPVKKKAVWDFYQSTISTRLSPNGAIIIIQTRWAEDDLTGMILANEDPKEWIHLNMPAINEYTGEALWPDRFSLAELERKKKTVGSFEWEALYMQRPYSPEGSLIKRDWLQFYVSPPDFEKYVISVDSAIKTDTVNDYSVLQIWGVAKNGYYLIRCWRDKVPYPELKKVVELAAIQYPGAELLIEDKASGQQLIQDFRAATTLPVIPMVPGRNMPVDKTSRVMLASPLFEAGKIFIPETGANMQEFIHELIAFPNGAHDDTVDACTQFAARILFRRQRSNVIALPVSTGGGFDYHGFGRLQNG